MKVIAPLPPPEMYRAGVEIDCQCARCGSSIEIEHCDNCDGGSDDFFCQCCGGLGFWRRCMSSPEYCEANPMEGREATLRGEVEWFTVEVET